MTLLQDQDQDPARKLELFEQSKEYCRPDQFELWASDSAIAEVTVVHPA